MGSDYSAWFGEIRLQPSRLLEGVVSCAGVCATLIVLAMPLPPMLRAALVALVLAGAGHAVWRHARMRPGHAVVAVKTSRQGMEVLQRDGHWSPATVLRSSFVLPWLVVLHLRLEGRRLMLPVVLLPDSMGNDDFRRLRVWLRWSGAAGRGAGGAAML